MKFRLCESTNVSDRTVYFDDIQEALRTYYEACENCSILQALIEYDDETEDDDSFFGDVNITLSYRCDDSCKIGHGKGDHFYHGALYYPYIPGEPLVCWADIAYFCNHCFTGEMVQTKLLEHNISVDDFTVVGPAFESFQEYSTNLTWQGFKLVAMPKQQALQFFGIGLFIADVLL